MTALLPATRDKAAKEQRKKLFQRMDTDPNHPGVITRHEACSGVSDLLKAQSPPLVTFDPLPVVFAAFDNASNVHQERAGKGQSDASKRSQEIELNEFRMFLANLRRILGARWSFLPLHSLLCKFLFHLNKLR